MTATHANACRRNGGDGGPWDAHVGSPAHDVNQNLRGFDCVLANFGATFPQRERCCEPTHLEAGKQLAPWTVDLPKESLMSEANKSILEMANAAIVKGDFEGFLKFCTEDTEWTFVGERTFKGKEAARKWMAEAYREAPKFEVHRMVAEDDLVIAIGEITVKNDKGKATRHEYCDVWRFHDGLMAELRAFVV
jgi:uncharacterized protein